MVLLPHGPDRAVQGQLAVAIPDSRGHGGTSRAPTPELLWVVAYKFWFLKSMLKEMWHFMLQSEMSAMSSDIQHMSKNAIRKHLFVPMSSNV